MKTKNKKMGSDIIAAIKRGRAVGYSDKLIKKSLELEGYTSASIRHGFREVEKGGNGNGIVVHTASAKKIIKKEKKAMVPKKDMPVAEKEIITPPAEIEPPAPPAEKMTPAPSSLVSEKPKKHWLRVCVEILIGIVVFSIVGMMLYLFFLPAVTVA